MLYGCCARDRDATTGEDVKPWPSLTSSFFHVRRTMSHWTRLFREATRADPNTKPVVPTF